METADLANTDVNEAGRPSDLGTALGLLPAILAALSAYAFVLSVIYTITWLAAAGEIDALPFFTLSDYVDCSIEIAAACVVGGSIAFFYIPGAIVLIKFICGPTWAHRITAIIIVMLCIGVIAVAVVAGTHFQKYRATIVTCAILLIMLLPFTFFSSGIRHLPKALSRAVEISPLMVMPIPFCLGIAVAHGQSWRACPPQATISSEHSAGTLVGDLVAILDRGFVIAQEKGVQFIPTDKVDKVRTSECSMSKSAPPAAAPKSPQTPQSSNFHMKG
jgi:hypothetical protein